MSRGLALVAAVVASLVACEASHAWTVAVGDPASPDNCGQFGNYAWEAAAVPTGQPYAGDVIVAGQVNRPSEGGGCDFIVSRRSRDFGLERWTTHIATASNRRQLLFFPNGDILVDGATKIRGSDGLILWSFLEKPAPPTFRTASGEGVPIYGIDAAGDVLGFWEDAQGHVRLAKIEGDTFTPGSRGWTTTTSFVGGFDSAGDVLTAGAKLDGSTGAEIWHNDSVIEVFSYEIIEGLTGGVDDIVVGGRYYTGATVDTAVSVVVRIDGATGAERWRYEFSGHGGFDIAARRGTGRVAFIETNQFGPLGVLDATTGTPLWVNSSGLFTNYRLHGNLAMTPDGDVFAGLFGTVPHTVAKLDGATGAQLWTHAGPDQYYSPRSDDSGNLLVAANQASGPGRVLWLAKVAADGTDFVGSPSCGNRLVEGSEDCDDGNVDPADGCSGACTVEQGWQCLAAGGACQEICGDTISVGRESCDLGSALNGTPGAICDAHCRLVRRQSGAVDAGSPCLSTAATASSCEPDGADATTPVAAGIEIPDSLGSRPVSLTVETSEVPKPTGFVLVDKQVDIDIDSSGATSTTPLIFRFLVDESVAPAVGREADLAVYRNGAVVGECPGASEAVPDDPCVRARSRVVSGPSAGDVLVEVLSSHASDWGVATKRGLSKEQAKCRTAIRNGLFDATSSALASLSGCIDGVNDGTTSPTCPSARTAPKVKKAFDKISEKKLAKACPLAVLPTIGLSAECEGATNIGALRSCLRDKARTSVTSLLFSEYAATDVVLGNPDENACQGSIAKYFGAGVIAASLKAYRVCDGKQDAGKVLACLDPKTQRKLDATLAKAAAAFAAACSDGAIQALAARGFDGECAFLSPTATGSDLEFCQMLEHQRILGELLGFVQ